MLTLQDELWIATNLSFLCFGNSNAKKLLAKIGGQGKTRIFLEIVSEVQRIHDALISTQYITIHESAAMKEMLTNYIKHAWRV